MGDAGLTGPQDHRGHVRRHGAPRRRRVQRQGPVQGGPIGGVRRPLGRQERRRRGPRGPVRDRAHATPSGSRGRCPSPSRRSRRASVPDERILGLIDRHFDLRPAAIIEALDLRRPIFRQTAAYGHFGRPDLDLPWERTDCAPILADEAGIRLPEPVAVGGPPAPEAASRGGRRPSRRPARLPRRVRAPRELHLPQHVLARCACPTRSRRSLDRFLGPWDALGARAWYRHWLDGADRAARGLRRASRRAGLRDRPDAERVGRAHDDRLGARPRPPRRRDRPARLRDAGLPVGAAPDARHHDGARLPDDRPPVAGPCPARRRGRRPARRPTASPFRSKRSRPPSTTERRSSRPATSTSRPERCRTSRDSSRLAHERGALLLVDAYQATGLLPTDLGAGPSDGRPDVYLSGTLKWLFGGPGNAFLWVRPELHDDLRPDDDRLVQQLAPVRVRRGIASTSRPMAAVRARHARVAEHVHRARRDGDRPGDRDRAAARADDRPRRPRDPARRRSRPAGAGGARRRTARRHRGRRGRRAEARRGRAGPSAASSSTTGRASSACLLRSTTPSPKSPRWSATWPSSYPKPTAPEAADPVRTAVTTHDHWVRAAAGTSRDDGPTRSSGERG